MAAKTANEAVVEGMGAFWDDAAGPHRHLHFETGGCPYPQSNALFPFPDSAFRAGSSLTVLTRTAVAGKKLRKKYHDSVPTLTATVSAAASGPDATGGRWVAHRMAGTCSTPLATEYENTSAACYDCIANSERVSSISRERKAASAGAGCCVRVFARVRFGSTR